MTPVYSHELGSYIALGRRTIPVREGRPELVLTPIVVELLTAKGRIIQAPAVSFFNHEGSLIIQAKETT